MLIPPLPFQLAEVAAASGPSEGDMLGAGG